MTTSIVKVLYGMFVVCVGLTVGESEIATVLGVVQIVATPIISIAALIYGRIFFESVVVFLRIAEHLEGMSAKTATTRAP